MAKLELDFATASRMLSDQTYLTLEDAESQLKIMYHVMKFTKSIGRAPERDELMRITEYCRRDQALAYRTMAYPSSMIRDLIKCTLKVNPAQIEHDPNSQT